MKKFRVRFKLFGTSEVRVIEAENFEVSQTGVVMFYKLGTENSTKEKSYVAAFPSESLCGAYLEGEADK